VRRDLRRARLLTSRSTLSFRMEQDEDVSEVTKLQVSFFTNLTRIVSTSG